MENISNNQIIIGIVTIIAIILVSLNIYKNKIGETTSIAITITILLFGGALIYGLKTNNKTIRDLLNNIERFDNDDDDDVEEGFETEEDEEEGFANYDNMEDNQNPQGNCNEDSLNIINTINNSSETENIYGNLLFAPTEDIIGVDTRIGSTSNASFDVRCSLPIPKQKTCPWMTSTDGPDLSRNTLDSCDNFSHKLTL